MAHITLSTFGFGRRRSAVCRFLAVTVTFCIFVLLLSNTNTSAASLPLDRRGDDLDQTRDSTQYIDDLKESDDTRRKQLFEQDRLSAQADEIHDGKNTKTTFQRGSEGQATALARPNFGENFEKAMALMPSPFAMKSLMAPFQDTREEHMEDVASRVRMFKVAFEAWESLHDHSIQNVVQHLRDVDNLQRGARAAIHQYDEFRSFINELGSLIFPGTKLSHGDHLSLHSSIREGGKGIVLTLGEGQVYMVLTSIRAFRKLGCNLPIEIMYLGDDDLGEDYRVMLEALPGVVTRDLGKMVDDKGWGLRGWAIKPWAILMSSFREALFMDADVLFLTNPEILFENSQYLESGALFFKDRNLNPEKKRKWLRKVLPSPISEKVQHNRLWTGESGHMQDSGVVVIDKWTHFVPLLLTTRLNGIDRDGNKETGKKGVYEMVYGDKETFWLSWEMAGVLEYEFHDGPTGVLGKLRTHEADNGPGANETTEEPHGEHLDRHDSDLQSEQSQLQNYTVCSPQLLHFDSQGKPLWLNGWLSANKYEAPNDVDLGAFQVYLKEPERKASDRTDMWELHGNNNCCLTATNFVELAEDEKQVLSMIIAVAKDYTWDV